MLQFVGVHIKLPPPLLLRWEKNQAVGKENQVGKKGMGREEGKGRRSREGEGEEGITVNCNTTAHLARRQKSGGKRGHKVWRFAHPSNDWRIHL